MKNLKHPVIEQILENGSEFIESRVQRYINWSIAKEKAVTELDIKYYRMSIQYSLINAMSNYLLKTDILKVNRFYFGPKGVEIQILIERDGEAFGLNTDVIIAEGEIQQAHYRYLVKTPLRKIGSTLVKQLKGIDKAEADVKYSEEIVARYQDQLNDSLNISFEEWLPKRSYHFRSSVSKSGLTYQEYTEKRPYTIELFEQEFERFKSEHTVKYNQHLIKGALKDLNKRTVRLESLKSAL